MVNRTAESVDTTACPAPETSVPPTASYDNHNQVTWAANTAPTGFTYDAAGDVLSDGVNRYLYDGEGRLCAYQNIAVAGNYGPMMGYVYGPDGLRVAKGTLTAWSCNLATNGLTITASYVLGPGGEQASEMAVSGATGSYSSSWQHTNVFVDGSLLATYNGTETYFALNDWLGTKRAEITPDGQSARFFELPYGNGLTSTGSLADATEQHFTGKERDSESGNDYFGARYYASTMGRFMSPDWAAKAEPVPYAKLDNPQSLNLYSYVGNNPLSRVDKDGHCSSPSVGKGQVGVCVDLYIQAKRIDLVGLGDNRGPAANDPKATYRVELQIVFDPKAGTVSLVKDDPGVSKALGGLFSNKGTDTTSPIIPTTDKSGTTHFTINNTALNGLHDLPGAPKDTIKTTINMDVTSGGKVGIEGGVRTAYPSMEIYSYSPSGQSTTILQMQEHNPSDLANQNQQIPQVAPQ